MMNVPPGILYLASYRYQLQADRRTGKARRQHCTQGAAGSKRVASAFCD
jgi:hypothetical protein